MARGARFALAASNPPPPRGRRQCSGGHTPLYTEGGKLCKKNPRHSLSLSLCVCACLNLIGPLFLSFTLFRSFLFSTPAGNRRRIYLSAGHVVVSRPPCSFFSSLSLSSFLLYLPLLLLSPLGLYPRAFKRDVCMYGRVYAGFYVEFLGRASREETYHAAVRNARRPCTDACVYACTRTRTHGSRTSVAHINLINPTDTSGPTCSAAPSTIMRTRVRPAFRRHFR